MVSIVVRMISFIDGFIAEAMGYLNANKLKNTSVFLENIKSRTTSLFIFGVVMLSTVSSIESAFSADLAARNLLTMKYSAPGVDWESESIPLGNGLIGATVLGGVVEDVIQTNEKSLWTGGPTSKYGYNFGFPKDAAAFASALQKVQTDIESKGTLPAEYVAAQLGNKHTGYGSYQSFGDLVLSWPKVHQDYHSYQRTLDLNSAIASVSYASGGVEYVRTYFISYPDNSLVVRLTASEPKKVSFSGYLRTPENRTRNVDLLDDDTVRYSGSLDDNGLQYAAGMRISRSGGKVQFNDAGHFTVSSADSVTLVFTSATNYALLHPDYRGSDATSKIDAQLALTRDQSYEDLKQRHLSDYQALFSRVDLDLEGGVIEDVKASLKAYPSQDPSQNRALETLYFQYGRYLLISSSRAGALPANLQGIWNKDINAPWSADYHLNINLQMNYWLATSTNLAETLASLYDYVENLVAPGQQAATTLFDSRGWVVFLNSNPWGSIGLIDWPTAFWQPEAAAWVALHFYEGYAFSQDTDFLTQRVYPLLKLTSQFWLDNLVWTSDKQSLVVSPSYSPEHGDFSAGAAMSQQIVYALLSKTKALATHLKDDAFRQEVTVALEKLEPGLRIGSWGQLQEWRKDLDSKTNKHRHVSHLFALHPGDRLSYTSTPLLAKAAEVSLNARGDAGTGWSRAWKVNFWARLNDGNRALRLLQHQLRDSTLSNLWSTHPPFQIDGNFGATAGVAEMLLQSHNHELHLLPALPEKWRNGRVSGLRGRGNFEISMEWTDTHLTKAVITSFSEGVVNVRNDKFGSNVIVKHNDIAMSYQRVDDTTISFNTSANQEYAVIVAD